MYVFLQLEYDVLEYVVIERLAQGGRDKLKDDGLNLSDWLQSLASFWGHLYVSVFLQDLVLLHIICHIHLDMLILEIIRYPAFVYMRMCYFLVCCFHSCTTLKTCLKFYTHIMSSQSWAPKLYCPSV